MDLIRSLIDKTLKGDDNATADYVKFVQQRAHQLIQSAKTGEPAAQPQTTQENKPSA